MGRGSCPPPILARELADDFVPALRQTWARTQVETEREAVLWRLFTVEGVAVV